MSDASDERPLILHLGAHRTASTSAQKAILSHIDAGATGIAFAGPETLRPRATRMVHNLALAPGGHLLATPLALSLACPKAAAVVRDRRPLRVISDEQFLGLLETSLLDPRGLYPHAARRGHILRRLLGRARARVVLTIRPYDDWFVSLYSWHALRRPLPPAETLANEWAARPRGWLEVVADIRKSFDDIEIVDFSTLQNRPRAVLRRLLGAEARSIQPLHLGRSLPSEALEEVSRRREAGEDVDLKDRTALLRKSGEASRLQPFDAETRDRLRQRYQDDLSALLELGLKVVSLDPKSIGEVEE